MSVQTSERPDPPLEPGWRDRFWGIGADLGRLLETRTAILREELAAKGELLGQGLLGLFVALVFGTIAGLLVTALVAALLAKLFGSVVLGILVTLLLDLAVAGGAALLGARRLSSLRPFDFPETRREIDRDLESLRRAAGVGGETPAGTEPTRGEKSPPDSTEEIEARLREGAG